MIEHEQIIETQSVKDQIQPEKKRKWEEVEINGEKFLAMRDFDAPLIAEGKEQHIPFKVDVYQHIESGVQMQVWKLGMDQPEDHPAPVRIDSGCPCMHTGGMRLIGHDCAQQQDMMFQTIAETGIGAMVIVPETTAAGNGWGSHLVFEQSTRQNNALQNGQHVPSMQEVHAVLGYHEDIRRHDIPANVLAHSVGTKRPVLATTANPQKIAYLKNSGLNVVDGVRIEFVTPSKSEVSQDLESRRRCTYLAEPTQVEAGAYLALDMPGMAPWHFRLTKEIYDKSLVPAMRSRSASKCPARRLN